VSLIPVGNRLLFALLLGGAALFAALPFMTRARARSWFGALLLWLGLVFLLTLAA